MHLHALATDSPPTPDRMTAMLAGRRPLLPCEVPTPSVVGTSPVLSPLPLLAESLLPQPVSPVSPVSLVSESEVVDDRGSGGHGLRPDGRPQQTRHLDPRPADALLIYAYAMDPRPHPRREPGRWRSRPDVEQPLVALALPGDALFLLEMAECCLSPA